MGPASCVFCNCLESFDHLFLRCNFSFRFWSNFNRFNTRGIFFVLDSFTGMWEYTLNLSPDNRIFAQSLLCLYGWKVWQLRNYLIFNGAVITNFRSFYFHGLFQFSLYTDLASDLESLYRSDEVILNLADVQKIQHLTP
jgi:hypothetical protein